ncbi:MAG TPA: NAD-dependent epimerase/dehydratase family protein [Chthoniobacteraceae bacterium]|nr:NAD-dependent epimerase/dehydratase family protein [Chthoniobacteraceae bacterium]
MKALVTGAAGFIGSHLVDRLLDRGDTVIGIDSMKLGRRDNLARAFEDSRFRLYEMDMTNIDACLQMVAKESKAGGFDLAWHMAANSDIPAGVADSDVDFRDTFLTTFNLLKLLRVYKIPRLAFASTSAIYGVHSKLLEEDLGPLFPISNYGAMKLASEAVISAALESFLERAWIFRFPNVVGARATHGAIYDFVRRLRMDRTLLEVLGDGSQEKPYFHVSELIDAMLFIVEKTTERLNYFNIGTGESTTTVRYIAGAVVKRMAPGARIHYGKSNRGWIGDVPRFNYSVDKLRTLGWSPRLTSNQAVDRAIEEMVSETIE